jgi:putative two-component system response regulator
MAESGSLVDATRGDSMKILIVEDNRLNLFVLAEYVKEKDIQVSIAANGEDALSLWKSECPEIVITDIEMPGVDGYSLIHQIRAQETDEYTYIIVLTAHDEIAILEKCFELGADDFIAKPVLKSELLHRIRAGERVLHQYSKNIIVYSLAQLTELRDLESGQHIKRIEAYAKLLANRLKSNLKYTFQITPRFLEELGPACMLHDVGKIAIDDQILRKPTSLNESEWQIMKTHTTVGQVAIDSIQLKHPRARFLKMAGEVARWHHERFDGAGYPDGLKGEEIPLAARIVALADVYDALVTQRVYKSSFGFAEAEVLIENESGRQFDPAIVNVFMQLAHEFRIIATTMVDINKHENHLSNPHP